MCLCLGLIPIACNDGGDGFFATSSGKGFDNPRRDMALPSAALADGALTLVPPRGFCIDKRSLRSSFAVVARCDSLGARRAAPDAPLGMIVVSVAQPQAPQVDLAAALAALAPQDAELLDSRQSDFLALMRLRGRTPEGADPRHWRGLARVGSRLLSVTAYAPTGGELSGAAGGRVLEILVQQTREASGGQSVAAIAPKPARKGLGDVIDGSSD